MSQRQKATPAEKVNLIQQYPEGEISQFQENDLPYLVTAAKLRKLFTRESTYSKA